MAALLMDLADVGGNVKDGCHIASTGGTWMMLTYGFGGLGTMTGRCPLATSRPGGECHPALPPDVPRADAGGRDRAADGDIRAA